MCSVCVMAGFSAREPQELLNGERLKETFGTDISVFAHHHH